MVKRNNNIKNTSLHGYSSQNKFGSYNYSQIFHKMLSFLGQKLMWNITNNSKSHHSNGNDNNYYWLLFTTLVATCFNQCLHKNKVHAWGVNLGYQHGNHFFVSTPSSESFRFYDVNNYKYKIYSEKTWYCTFVILAWGFAKK